MKKPFSFKNGLIRVEKKRPVSLTEIVIVSGTYTTYNNETDKKYYCKHHLIDDVDQTECC